MSTTTSNFLVHKNSSNNKCLNNTRQDNNSRWWKANSKLKWFNCRHRVAKRWHMGLKMGLLRHQRRLVADIRILILPSTMVILAATWILLRKSLLTWLSGNRSNLKWFPKPLLQLIAAHLVNITTHKISQSTIRQSSHRFCKHLKDPITKCNHKPRSSLLKDTIQLHLQHPLAYKRHQPQIWQLQARSRLKRNWSLSLSNCL